MGLASWGWRDQDIQEYIKSQSMAVVCGPLDQTCLNILLQGFFVVKGRVKLIREKEQKCVMFANFVT